MDEVKINNECGKWHFNDYKKVKVFGKRFPRIAFQRNGKYSRGVSLSIGGFSKMEDVSITPGMRVELEPNVFLTNNGNHVHLVKYCMTDDQKRCDGGFFSFTPKEWMYFWTCIRSEVNDFLKK